MDDLKALLRQAFVLLSLLLFMPVTAMASDFYFKCLDVESGLSQNSVYDIIQDSYGRIWAATGDGVSVYDGDSFRIFNRSSAGNGLRSNVTICLHRSEDGRIYVGTREGLSVYDPVAEAFSAVELTGKDGESVSGLVRDMATDRNGDLWVVVANYGLFKVDRNGDCTPVPLLDASDRAGRYIRSLCLAGDGNIWVSTNSKGLFRYSPATGEIRLFGPKENPLFRDIWKIASLDRNTLLVGCSQKGLYMFDLRSHTFLRWKSQDGQSITETIIHDIYIDRGKKLWVGTENGLYVCENGSLYNLRHSPNDDYSLSDNSIHSIAEDSEGGMWVGSFFGGINYYSEYTSQFAKICPGDMPGDLKGKSISEMCEDRDGNLWIATEDAGLNFYDGRTKTFSSGFIDATNVHALALVGDSELWVGTYMDGLYVLDVNTGRYRHFVNDGKAGSLIDDSVYSIYKGFDDSIWIGTIKGLCRYDSMSGRFEHVRKDMITSSVNDISEDLDGRLWFATIGQGVFRYDGRNDVWDNPGFDCDERDRITQAIILLLDKEGNMWVGTEGKGVFRFDRTKQSFDSHYDESDGLPNGVIYKLLEDEGGNIWGSTNKGLFRISPDNGQIITVNSENGLIYNQFNYKSGVRLHDGRLLFGCVKGIASFDPDHLRRLSTPPTILFNKFLLFNESVNPGADGSPLRKSIMASDEIVLNPHQSVFSVGFTGIDYSERQDVNYYYMLKGLDEEWIPADKTATITFSRLLPAKYTLTVKAVSMDGLWPPVENSLDIKVLPPWYKTFWARVLFVLMAMTLCSLAVWLIVLYYKRRNNQVFERIQRTKEKELYNSKIDFFTNITHEIRTPLTLITVPIENVMNNIGENDKNYEVLSIIRRNANRLLKLVNELMDFRKIDPAVSQLNFRRIELVKLVRETCGRFSPSAAIKGIELRTSLPEDDVMADVDGEVFTKILSNLLSNALKHAAHLISLSLVEDGLTFTLSVSNDGDRIPAGEKERIFEPFVKLDKNSEGTGIGLPFARNLAEMHSGSLTLDTSTDYVTFVLELPLRQKNVIMLDSDVVSDWDAAAGKGTEPIDRTNKTDARTVLVVDDNAEFRVLMTDTLTGEYNVLTATDGDEGLRVLAVNKVDLIISDLIMPGKDGMEFCAEVKANINYSHIPFILLTAKTDPDTQVSGLNNGADDYIPKPFSPKILLARIDSLLRLRARLCDTFLHSPTEPVSSIAHSKSDEMFMKKIMDYVYDHIEDTELDVDDIAKAMYMSRATLYRKLKGISELSPNDFIRLCRLKRAAELLKENVYKVNEVAYIVGFSSPSYFSKCFQKQFGVLPKDYCD